MNLSNDPKVHSLAPYAEVVQTSTFVLFIPHSGMSYSPVLLHIDYKDICNSTHKLVRQFLDAGPLPLVAITYGNTAESAASLVKYLRKEDLLDTFNGILSISNEDIGFLDGFATTFDNLPFSLEEKLHDCFMMGKYSGNNIGNRVAEAIAAMENKPAVTCHLYGKDGDLDVLNRAVEHMSVQYPTYNYIANMSLPAPARPPRKEGCMCCGHQSRKLRNFYKIQGNLCAACAQKMKDLGGVDLVNFFTVQSNLNAERAQTHKANYLAKLRKVDTCPSCEGELEYLGHHEHICADCHKRVWLKRGFLYSITQRLGQDWVYKYNAEHTALVGCWPITDNNEVVKCSYCGGYHVDYTSLYDYKTNSTAFMCTSCKINGNGEIRYLHTT